ncbi:aldose epimerase family protein [Martelella sp. HB161492]|uniref:aldose epimerase family protein n=1 Tax=Martelella sp. HB161492 TaxID=2720726 RepID=UPI0015913DC7|nr:aldose epimerase family protein [Martelella sp. HB161492]
MAQPEREVFGTTETGETVYRVTITGGGLTAKIINWGAVIQDLRMDGHDAPLVLGYPTFEPYPAHSPFFGATPGRCSNRIGNGVFTLDGVGYQLDLNENGVSHLHGGFNNTAVSLWEFEEIAEDHVTLVITDQEGRGGYPGNTVIRARYALSGNGTLSVIYEAETDKATLANLCNHSYFNLSGEETIFGHELMIAAEHYLPTDDKLIPTGELRPVDGTEFDFRVAKPIGQLGTDGLQVPYDSNFCLSSERGAKRKVVEAFSPVSGIRLSVATTEAGVQFYAGVHVGDPAPGLADKPYGPYAGFCLETQVWPDAINHPGFPNAVLRPGETLVQDTDYIFEKA